MQHATTKRIRALLCNFHVSCVSFNPRWNLMSMANPVVGLLMGYIDRHDLVLKSPVSPVVLCSVSLMCKLAQGHLMNHYIAFVESQRTQRGWEGLSTTIDQFNLSLLTALARVCNCCARRRQAVHNRRTRTKSGAPRLPESMIRIPRSPGSRTLSRANSQRDVDYD